MSDDFKRVESHDCPMSTFVTPAGSPCRTGKNKVAIQYHTARFRLVPQLAKALSVPTPAVCPSRSGGVGAPPARAQSSVGERAGRRDGANVACRGTRGRREARRADPLLRCGLEFLTGELKGSHDPSGIVFTVLAAMSGMEREYIRDCTLEGHESARKLGKTIGGAG
ncbi:zinc finger domain-containing protein [Streptomyces nodosus]|uniref:zinc finger domain-containing protein n=1 Tax=Streptomyces nodosus TaxID=40318 RepID=UPI00382F030F